MPFTKLFGGLGLACGLAGYAAVGKLGGSQATWVATWEAWVALHIAFSVAAHRLNRASLRASAQHAAPVVGTASVALPLDAVGCGAGGGGTWPTAYESSGSGWLPIVMWLLLGLVVPVLCGTLTFR